MKKLLLVLIGLVIVNNLYSEELKWEKFGDLKSARNHFQALPINDSTILVMGGYNNHSSEKVLRTCEFINVKSNTVTPAPSMSVSRAEFVALLTKDSNVIVFGGINSSYQGENSVELFDRKTNTWKRLSNMLQRRIQHAAAFISNTEILIICGRETSSSDGSNRCEIYDYVAQKSTYTGDYPQGGCSGSLVVSKYGEPWGFGFRLGAPDSYRTDNVYYYDRYSKTWKLKTKMLHKVQNIPFCKLKDGRIVASNGSIRESNRNYSNQVLIYENDVFVSEMISAFPTEWHSLIRFRDNSVMKIGGLNSFGSNEKTTEIFDFETKTAVLGPPLNTDRAVASVVHLGEIGNKGIGAIVAIGGCNSGYSNSLNSIEILRFIVSSDISINSKIDNCEFSDITISSNFDVVQIKNIESKNVSVSHANLPSTNPNIKISLLNRDENGYYTLELIDSKGKAVTIKDSILSKANAINIQSSLLNDNVIDFGYCEVNKTVCTDVTLKNDRNIPVTIKKINLKNNLQYQYSYPQLNLPITLQPYQSQTIKICFTPNNKEIIYDTLLVEDDCNNYSIPMSNKVVEPFIDKVDISNECGVYVFEVESENKIMDIQLQSNSSNVIINNSPSLPAYKIIITVSLINKDINGICNVRVIDSIGTKLDISKEIVQSQNITSIESNILSHKILNFGYCAANKTFCNDVVLKNQKNYPITIHESHLLISEYYSIDTQIQFPLTLQPYQSKIIRICFNPEQKQLYTDTLYVRDDCNEYKIPIINSTDEPIIIKTELSNECGIYIFEIKSDSRINNVNLNSNSSNVKISISPSLPNSKVIVTVSLLDENKNGNYIIDLGNESYVNDIVQGTLFASGISLEIVSPLDSLGFFNVEKTGLSKIKPDTIKLKNNGFTDILIDSIYIYYNVMFSVPQSQIPLLVKAGETVELQVYYMPFKLGEAKDSIRFFGRCLDFLIRLKSEGIPNHYSNETKCGSVVTLSSYKLNTILQGPYPNPTDNSFSIILSKRIAENDLVLVDFYGNQAEMKIQTCTTYDENYKLYNILIGNVNSGNYFLTDKNRTFYSIINKSN